MNDQASRHQLFDTARTRAGWSVQQLWVAFLAVGGTGDVFDVDAFLHGMSPLTTGQQDALAVAVNEQLSDLYLAARVPYLHPSEYVADPVPDLQSVFDDLIDRQRGGRGS